MTPRVRTALALAPGFLAIVALGGVWGLAFLVAAAAALCAREYMDLVGPDAHELERFLVPCWAGVIVLGFLCGDRGVPALLIAIGAAVYLFGWIIGPGPTQDTITRWSAALGAWVFTGLFLGYAVWVRQRGIWPLLFVCAVVWSGDIAAYYVGRAIGEHRLAPRVSPNKTIEGALGSVLAGACVAFAMALFAPLPHAPLAAVGIGLVVNAAAQVGDLAESLLKRCAGVKDSGTLLPGHGGMLDRLDGFLLALPVYALFLSTGG